MKIGLAFSGGGFRATVFHLGVLERLARAGRLGDVVAMSTVSGGSICIALVFAANGNQWPDDATYRDKVLPKIRGWLMTVNLQRQLFCRALRHPLRLFQTRADDLSHLLQKKIGLTARVQELPDRPRWIINTACYESGAMFRIEKRRMGDYKVGSVDKPNIFVSDAVAASAGFPVGIGPLKIETKSHQWFRFLDEGGTETFTQQLPRLHLWDGGVYDNLGSEPLFEPCVGPENCDFLLVSDAAGQFRQGKYKIGFRPLKRLIDIATFQVRALRARSLVEYFKQHPGSGVYLQIDNTCRHIAKTAPPGAGIGSHCTRTLTDDDVARAAAMSTHIHNLTAQDFNLLFRQGYEVANATLAAWYGDEFAWQDY